MSIIVFLTVGLIAGWIASNFVEGRGYGAFGDIVIGIVGAFIGSVLFEFFGVILHGFWGSLLIATVGAVAFLFVVDLIAGKRTTV